MNSTLSSTITFNTNALVKSTNLDSSFQLQNVVLQPRFDVAMRAELIRMTRHTEDIVEMLKRAAAYHPLQRSHMAFSPVLRDGHRLHCLCTESKPSLSKIGKNANHHY